MPLLALGLKPLQGDDLVQSSRRLFFDDQPQRLQVMTVWPRTINSLWGLLLLGVVWRWVRGLSGTTALASMSMVVFYPPLLAMGGYATTDLAVTALFAAAVTLFEKARREPSFPAEMVAGVVAALALMAKIEAWALIPVYVLLEIFRPVRPFPVRRLLSRWGFGVLGAFLTINIMYIPVFLRQEHSMLPIFYYFGHLRKALGLSLWDYPYYFLGQARYGTTPFYFPLAFVLKSPLPFLIALAASIAGLLNRRIRIPAMFWITPLAYGLFSFFLPNMGVRLLLPAFPFLAVVAGLGLGWIATWRWGRTAGAGRWLAAGLAAWLAIGTLSIFPRHMSYSNEMVPGGSKWKVLGDFDLDWGQDHQRLAETARRRGWKEIRLAFLGSVDPAFYGVPWRRWTVRDLQGPQAGCVYAVNAAFVQRGAIIYPIVRPIAEGWIRKARPTGRVGDTWLYYEIPGEPQEDPTPWLPSAPCFSYTYPPVVTKGEGNKP